MLAIYGNVLVWGETQDELVGWEFGDEVAAVLLARDGSLVAALAPVASVVSERLPALDEELPARL